MRLYGIYPENIDLGNLDSFGGDENAGGEIGGLDTI